LNFDPFLHPDSPTTNIEIQQVTIGRVGQSDADGGNIATTLATINSSIATHLEQLGFQLPGVAQRCPHMFGAQLPKRYSGDLVTAMKESNIYISQRGDALRFAGNPLWAVRGDNRAINIVMSLMLLYCAVSLFL
jgi:hypothetical protein